MPDLQPTAARQFSETPLAQPFRFVGRPIAFTFPLAEVDTEVRHQAGEVPDGFLVLRSLGYVSRAPVSPWATKDLAYLRSSEDTNDVIVQFVVFKEEPLNVNP